MLKARFIKIILIVCLWVFSIGFAHGGAFMRYCENPDKDQVNTVKALFKFFTNYKDSYSCKDLEESILISDIVYMGNITDLSIFKYFNHFKIVRLRLKSPKRKNIAYLKHLKTIKWLDITSDALFDLSPILKLQTLKKLHLGFPRDIDVNFSPLNKLINLEYMALGGGRFDKLPAWDNLTKLEDLLISATDFSDISNVKYLINLKKLAISNNEIESLEGIEALKNLKSLRFTSNNISDISPLKNLTNLESISMMRNPITDISALSNFKKLRSLTILGRRLKWCSPKTIEEIQKGISCENDWWTNVFKKF